MPPSAPIDSDVSGTTLYVLESNGLWAGSPVGTGDAVWTQLLDAADYPDLTGLTFGRVRVAGATIYVTAGTGSEGGTGDAYMFVSNSAGITWNYYLIATDEIEIKPYTMDVRPWALVGDTVSNHDIPVLHRRYDGEQAKNPWAVGYTFNSLSGEVWDTRVKLYGALPNAGVNMVPGVDGTMYSYEGPLVFLNQDLPDYEKYTLTVGYLDDYFGVGGWDYLVGLQTSMPMAAERVYLGYVVGTAAAYGNPDTVIYSGVSYALFRYPQPMVPIALDYAPSNPRWVYVGTENKILRSMDGGVTWEALFTDAGANDIRVDPQLAGVFYTWRTTGALEQIVAGAVNATLDTETPIRTPLRLARAANSGKLWALKSGTTLRLRNLGAWSDQQVGLAGATGLQAYLGDKLIFVDSANIYVSDDGGTTIALKKGGWTDYGNGVNGHRLVI